MLDQDFHSADLENCHGIVIETMACEETSRKLADSWFEKHFCEEKVEKDFLIRGKNFWVFVWKAGVSVQMPIIMKMLYRANSMIPKGMVTQIDTLHNYLKK